jgi:2-amino-4-hydroxy-6-hydroxymethyldihydropteridine diphosphokinase
MPGEKVFLSLGSNLGDRERNLYLAVECLRRETLKAVQESCVYETAPQDLLEQPAFLNMVVCGTTASSAWQVLNSIASCETLLGRTRDLSIPKGPRPIDIDILLFGDVVVREPGLDIPHPRMVQRRFVLQPLLEIAPELCNPENWRTFRSYLTGSVLEQKVVLYNTSLRRPENSGSVLLPLK